MSGTQTTTVQNTASAVPTDSQVATIVQQLDTQESAVVDRISRQFADVACTPDTVRRLLDALHSGTSVALNANGRTATFDPTGAHLGYGEAYIALALAAEALRNAGVTSCATPEQWQAVLMGGPLAAAGTTSTSTTRSATASSSSQFPGIIALHSQGQGWGQIAQTTNVQLGQILNSANSSLNLNTTSGSGLTPTGKTSAEMNQGRTSTSTTPSTSSSSDTTSATKSSTEESDEYGKGDRGKHKGKAKGKGDHDDDTRSSATESKPQPDR